MSAGAARRPALRSLSLRLGILPEYRSTTGSVHATSDATREALARAMGFDGSSEANAAEALTRLDERDRSRLLEPVAVVRLGSHRARRVRVRHPAPGADLDYRVELREESGRTSRAEGRLESRARTWVSLPVPGGPEPGYHELRVDVETRGRRVHGRQRWILTPGRCVEPDEILGGRRAFGVIANLYALRARADQGAGDLGVLDRLVAVCAEAGAAFVGLNPLHALANAGEHVCPYLPVSRLFRNPLYVDLEAVPELVACREAREAMASEWVRDLRALTHVDYDRAAAHKLLLLRRLYHVHLVGEGDAADERRDACQRYLADQGDALRDFATFMVLAERHRRRAGRYQLDWSKWPAAHRDASSPEVEEFRRAVIPEVHFHYWLQFELDRQLSCVASRAERRGLPIGLYTDLALGSAATGSDTWANPDLFARSVHAGAPPDDFATQGQDWSFPPLDPHRLRESGYDYWIRLLRAGFAHAGALRIDHVMGLTRLFWIPRGRPAREGAYVSYPAADLLGILALESRRAGALAIGEDLGTVPEGLSARLARSGVLSSRVVYFERSGDEFRPARELSSRALATANTHDLPTLAGFLSGQDLRLRRRVGLIESDEELEEALAERERSVAALCRRLHAEGLLPGEAPPGVDEFAAAVTDFLCRSPAPLVGLSVDDLVGEEEAVNLPGAPQPVHPSWTRRLRVDVEDLERHPLARALLEIARKHRGGPGRAVGPETEPDAPG